MDFIPTIHALDFAPAFLIWAVLALGAAVGVFVLILTGHRVLQVLARRRRDRAIRRWTPVVERIASGEWVAGDPRCRWTPGGNAWMAVEALLRQALGGDDAGSVARIRTFILDAGFSTYYLGRTRHGSRWERAIAVVRLGEFGHPQAVPVLIAATRDPVREVRTAAVRALGNLGEEESLTVLAELLEAVSVGRGDLSPRVVAAALARFGDRAAQVLGPLLTHEAWRVRGLAVYLLGEARACDWLPGILERLADPEADVRAKAARALGLMAAHSALFPLLGRLEDPAWLVRMHAARALGALGDAPVVGALARRLTDAHWRVRQEAARALAHMGEGEAQEVLIHTVTTTPDRFAREQVVEELQRARVIQHAIDRLAEETEWATESPVPDATNASPSRRLLEAVAGSGSMSLLLGSIGVHPDARVRRTLIRLVGELEGGHVQTCLARAAKRDPDPLVRREAAVRLARRRADVQVA